MAQTEIGKTKIIVGSSTANFGPGFDILSVGLTTPSLLVTLEKNPQHALVVNSLSECPFPEGRIKGYSATQVLRELIRTYPIDHGINLTIKDRVPFPMGGGGRSGAEAVGAVMAFLVAHNISSTCNEVIALCSQVEPGGHADNVAASVNGKINIITQNPFDCKTRSVITCDPPDNLGLLIGVSSHKKDGGTEKMREVIKEPISTEDFIYQTGLVAALVASIAQNDVPGALRFILGDNFHEKRRANILGYGGFNFNQLFEFKKWLYENHGIALAVSGAGPNMALFYNKASERQADLNTATSDTKRWFSTFGVTLNIENREIAKKGAYDYAIERYGYAQT